MADIWDFFENMDELVYVADMDTYDMVYMNRRAMTQYALTSPEQYQNRKCYELLQSCSSPCAMCTNSKLCPGEFFEWSHCKKSLYPERYHGNPGRQKITD